MQPSSQRLLLVVLVLCAVLAGYFLLRVPAQTDAEQNYGRNSAGRRTPPDGVTRRGFCRLFLPIIRTRRA